MPPATGTTIPRCFCPTSLPLVREPPRSLVDPVIPLVSSLGTCLPPLLFVDHDVERFEVLLHSPHQSNSCPPRYLAPPCISPKRAIFGSLSSLMRATNPAKHSRRLRTVASTLSLQPAVIRALA
ncbi:unnamed protein product [Pylaiella littoralis]